MSKLEVVGNLWHRYDNSSPRYSVRTTMPSLVPSPKFPTFPTYKTSITLLLFVVCFGKSRLNPITKIGNFCDNPLSPISLFTLEMEFKHILYVPALYFYILGGSKSLFKFPRNKFCGSIGTKGRNTCQAGPFYCK